MDRKGKKKLRQILFSKENGGEQHIYNAQKTNEWEIKTKAH